MVRAEVHCKDVVTEAREVIQLSEVALQRTAGETGFVNWSQKTKHKGIQTGRQVAKEVVCSSQSVGEEIQALFSVTVDLSLYLSDSV